MEENATARGRTVIRDIWECSPRPMPRRTLPDIITSAQVGQCEKKGNESPECITLSSDDEDDIATSSKKGSYHNQSLQHTHVSKGNTTLHCVPPNKSFQKPVSFAANPTMRVLGNVISSLRSTKSQTVSVSPLFRSLPSCTSSSQSTVVPMTVVPKTVCQLELAMSKSCSSERRNNDNNVSTDPPIGIQEEVLNANGLNISTDSLINIHSTEPLIVVRNISKSEPMASPMAFNDWMMEVKAQQDNTEKCCCHLENVNEDSCVDENVLYEHDYSIPSKERQQNGGSSTSDTVTESTVLARREEKKTVLAVANDEERRTDLVKDGSNGKETEECAGTMEVVTRDRRLKKRKTDMNDAVIKDVCGTASEKALRCDRWCGWLRCLSPEVLNRVREFLEEKEKENDMQRITSSNDRMVLGILRSRQWTKVLLATARNMEAIWGRLLEGDTILERTFNKKSSSCVLDGLIGDSNEEFSSDEGTDSSRRGWWCKWIQGMDEDERGKVRQFLEEWVRENEDSEPSIGEKTERGREQTVNGRETFERAACTVLQLLFSEEWKSFDGSTKSYPDGSYANYIANELYRMATGNVKDVNLMEKEDWKQEVDLTVDGRLSKYRTSQWLCTLKVEDMEKVVEYLAATKEQSAELDDPETSQSTDMRNIPDAVSCTELEETVRELLDSGEWKILRNHLTSCDRSFRAGKFLLKRAKTFMRTMEGGQRKERIMKKFGDRIRRRRSEKRRIEEEEEWEMYEEDGRANSVELPSVHDEYNYDGYQAECDDEGRKDYPEVERVNEQIEVEEEDDDDEEQVDGLDENEESGDETEGQDEEMSEDPSSQDGSGNTEIQYDVHLRWGVWLCTLSDEELRKLKSALGLEENSQQEGESNSDASEDTLQYFVEHLEDREVLFELFSGEEWEKYREKARTDFEIICRRFYDGRRLLSKIQTALAEDYEKRS